MMSEKPNVLIIMSDQHHADIMGCAGNAIVKTPALDRLALEGVQFSNTYCPFPLCGPSRMSFMTQRYPHEIGLWDNQAQLDSDIPTFAHAFLKGGYDTILAGRMHFVGWDQRHGFAQRITGDVAESSYLSAGWKLQNVLGDLRDTPGMSLTGVLKSGPGRTGYHAYDETVTQSAVDWLGQRGKANNSKPFLLTVGYVSPHCPFVSPPEDFEQYADKITLDDLPQPEQKLHPANTERRKRFETDPVPPLDAQWRARVAYYGLCSFLDRQIGRVLQMLDDSGMAKNTIVVYTSDHGEMLGEHGMWWKSTFYDAASRVPLIVSWPNRIHGGRTVSKNVSLIDIGATVLDLAEIDPLPVASGKSFQSLLTDNDGEWDDTVFAEYVGSVEEPPSRMIRSGPWKYNYYHGMRPELFNLEEDPNELNDRWDDPTCLAVRQRLHELVLRDWSPDRVVQHMRTLDKNRELIGNWIKVTKPTEPNTLWFDQVPENWVDNTVTPGH